MKKAAKSILLIGAVYGVFAFISMQYDFSEWSKFSRGLFIFIVIIIVIAIYNKRKITYKNY